MTNDEINTLMATEVMGWRFKEDDHNWYLQPMANCPPPFWSPVKDWNPTTDMNQAMKCATEYLKDPKTNTLNTYYGGSVFVAEIFPKGSNVKVTIRDYSPALAICKAILKAKGLYNG